VDRELVGEIPALGDLDRVDLADEVGDRRVGRGELLAETSFAMHPLDRRVFTALGQQEPGVLRHRRVRVVVDLAAGDRRCPLVEQADERADDARLRLAPLAEEDDVVAGEQRVLELGQHRVVEADDPVDQGLAGGDARQGVRPDLLLDGPRLPTARSQLAEGAGAGHGLLQGQTGSIEATLLPASRSERISGMSSPNRRP
jgi:hypothetical protein